MEGILISAKSFTDSSGPYLLIANKDNSLMEFPLNRGLPVTIKSLAPEQKFCCGWYNIAKHTNHPCPNNSLVDQKYDSCFACRSKTNFNPAFYNTSDISKEQQAYNQTPHTVYIAYFGSDIAKVGIMSDSRGLTRLYEQGAILYSVISTFANADLARKEEKKLVNLGLKESVRKSQKELSLNNKIDPDEEKTKFLNILNKLDLEHDTNIRSNLDLYFFDTYPNKVIKKLPDNEPVSGNIEGLAGNYLILENNDRLYGYWLSDLYGYQISINNELLAITPEPEQVGLF